MTVGGLTANVTAVTNSALFATAPRHPPGLVDIVVTNPGGETVTVRGAFTYIPLTITSFEPDLGYPGMDLFIGGTGFLPGRVVTFGGVRAETGPANSTTQIAFTTPDHDLGTVDIVVTNPGGESASLVGGFTYWPTPVVAVTPASVAPGGELTVTWVAPLQFTLDWIGLFKVGDHNTQFIRYIYVCCRTSGSSRLAAPTQPGQYEVRYLPHEQYFDVARSSTVTVVPGPVTATDGLTSWLTGPRQLPPPWR